MNQEGRTSANAVVVDKLPTEIVRLQAYREQERMDPFMEARMLVVLNLLQCLRSSNDGVTL